MIRIYIRDPKVEPAHHYRYDASVRWAHEHDNGALISCGLVVGERLNGRVVLSAVPRGAVEVSHDEWNHSGCRSGCVLRGARECRW